MAHATVSGDIYIESSVSVTEINQEITDYGVYIYGEANNKTKGPNESVH